MESRKAITYVVEPGGIFRSLSTLPVGHRVRGGAWAPDGASVLLGEYQPSSDVVLFNVD